MSQRSSHPGTVSTRAIRHAPLRQMVSAGRMAEVQVVDTTSTMASAMVRPPAQWAHSSCGRRKRAPVTTPGSTRFCHPSPGPGRRGAPAACRPAGRPSRALGTRPSDAPASVPPARPEGDRLSVCGRARPALPTGGRPHDVCGRRAGAPGRHRHRLPGWRRRPCPVVCEAARFPTHLPAETRTARKRPAQHTTVAAARELGADQDFAANTPLRGTTPDFRCTPTRSNPRGNVGSTRRGASSA